MPKTILLIGIHSHQPVGNFDDVFQFAYDHAYVPLLEHLDRHPRIKVTLHYSGCLIEWLEVHHPEFLARVREVVARGQAEIMSGGFYEPILPVLPPEDAVAQLRMLTDYVKERFGTRARGFWLAERVWEPTIPSLVARVEGLRYTVLDQSHFLASGVGRDEAHGYYVTEDQGHALAVFPIDYTLRYTIPWKPVQATMEYLRAKHEAGPGRGWTFADDGEKFGAWPETWEHIIKGGWLEEFFTAVEEAGDWLQTETFGEFLAAHPPSGRAYLPTVSYPEMLRWSLPPHVAERLEAFLETLPEEGEERAFVQPGFWRNFMAKYPEANNLHKRMMRASRRVRSSRADEKTKSEAYRHVLRSQCNCPYWHGVFGGLYLNFLRHATYAEMLTGEAQAVPIEGLLVEEEDFDADGQTEVIIENPAQVLIFSPHAGGALREWDWRAFPTNLIDTLARRREAYHAKVAEAVVKGSEGSADLMGVTPAKIPGLEKLLAYDRYNRWCLIDLFPPPETTLDAFAHANYADEGNFATGAYSWEISSDGASAVLTMEREGSVRRSEERWSLRIVKRIEVDRSRPGMRVGYVIENRSGRVYRGIFGCEWNFGLLAGMADDRYYLVNGQRGPGKMHLGSSGEHDDVREIALVDHWQEVDIRIGFSAPARLWRYPVETVSLSEGGYEKTYQASAVFPYWEIVLEPGARWRMSMRVRVETPTWHLPGEESAAPAR